VCVCVCLRVHVCARVTERQEAFEYGVALISRLLKIIGLFCKKDL